MSPPRQVPASFYHVQMVFTALFTLELGLRLLCYGSSFWTRSDCNFNIMDFILVVAAIADHCLHDSDESIHLTGVRIVRVCRITKSLRVFRMLKFFSEARLMLATVISSVRILVWAALMMIFVIFICAIVVMQLTTSKKILGDHESDADWS